MPVYYTKDGINIQIQPIDCDSLPIPERAN